MQEVFEFLENNPVQYCATIGLDGKPKVRPFQMMYHEQGNLFYCTGAKKRCVCRAYKKSIFGNKRFYT